MDVYQLRTIWPMKSNLAHPDRFFDRAYLR